jgi:hypothetical protein
VAEDWTEIEVFADRLQADGDPRGELLALELAAERATDSIASRRLNREAQRIRNAHRALVWPSALADAQLELRAGFVVSANYDAIAGSSIPLELLLSVRDLSVGHDRRLEDCAPLLDRARDRGLRLDALRQSTSAAGPAIDLARLRKLDTLEQLSVAGPVITTEVLAKFAKLVSCSFGGPLRQAELCSLAPLKLEHLGLHGQVDPVIVPLFGNTLTSLWLRAWSGSLAPLQALPWLRTLRLDGPLPAGAIAELDGLLRLEELMIPTLDEATLPVLSRLPLRRLTVRAMSSRLAAGLARLRTLESLTIYRVEDGAFDVAPLNDLAQLRRLAVQGALIGKLTLPPTFERLAVGVHRPAAIFGEVAELAVIDGDFRNLRPLLASVRKLRLVWVHTRPGESLTDLPRLLPRLERLELRNHRDREFAWPEVPEILDALPRLRGFEMDGATVQELAEIARAFPELCPLTGKWPRSCDERHLSRISMSRSDPAGPRPRADEFAPLRSWASALRADKDVRGELLELELAAECTDDDAEARALNAEALELRLRHPRIAWPAVLGNDYALLRGGMVVHGSAGWIDRFVPPLEQMMQLRRIDIDTNLSVDTCIANLVRAQVSGMQLDRLRINVGHGSDALWLTAFERLAGSGISWLELLAPLRAEQLQRFPPLPLRHLGLCAGNFDLRWIHRYASTIESLTLIDTHTPTNLAGLELPRLAKLELGHGWTGAAAFARIGLRWLGLSCSDADQLGLLAELGPYHLRVRAAIHDVEFDELPREMRELLLELPEFLDLELEDSPLRRLARMANLQSFSLEWRSDYRDPPEQITLELPKSATALSLPAIDTRFVIRGGAIETLACRSDAIVRMPPEQCAGIRKLTLSDTEMTREVIERLGRIESTLPRLRTLVLPRFSVQRLAELAPVVPRVQLHPVDPGLRQLDSWPRPAFHGPPA